MMILIVDDSMLIVDRLNDILAEMKDVETVLHAANLTEAERLVNSKHPDIILLDINLPDGSGIDLLRTIKNDYPDIIVIMLTNQVNEYYRKLCKKLGANYFADKSTDFEMIPEIISSLNI